MWALCCCGELGHDDVAHTVWLPTSVTVSAASACTRSPAPVPVWFARFLLGACEVGDVCGC